MRLERIKELRVKKRLSQEKLAEATHCTQQAIANYETGKNEPSIESLVILADYFHVSTDYLLGRTNIMRTIKRITKEQLINNEPDFIAAYRNCDEKIKKLIEILIENIANPDN